MYRPRRARKRPPKYQNTKLVVEGHSFDSIKEATRYKQLALLKAHGYISDLKCQVPFTLIPKQRNALGKTEICVRYVADFVYMDIEMGCRVVEDVKSDVTRKLPVYVIKRKLMLQVHGITIREV